MTIIADATALILLGKLSVLEMFVKRNDMIIPKIVYEEVIKGKEKGRKDSFIVEKLVQEGKLNVKIPNKSIKDYISKLFNIKGGELDVISLAYKTKHTILSDDKKCLNSAKVLEIDFIISLDIIIVFCKKKIITKQKALEYIELLEEYGWYNKNLIKNYKEIVK